MRIGVRQSFWITLAEGGVSVGLFIALISGGFAAINWWFPDPTNPWSVRHAPALIRFAIAALVVLTPVWWVLRVAHEQTKQLHPVRWWVVAACMFAGAFVLVGDAVALLYQWLSGDLTLPTLLKIVWLGMLAGGAVMLYYPEWQKGDAHLPLWEGKYARVAVAVLVASFVVVGFTTVGSPSYARNLRFDEMREQALRELVWRLQAYATEHGTLPNSLEELPDFSFAGNRSFVDPQTGEPFRYRAISDNTFEVCATFALPSPLWRACAGNEQCTRFVGDEIALHPAGEFCVKRRVQEGLQEYPKQPPPLD